MKINDWLNNSRFYVLASAVLLSIGVAGWLQATIVTDQLFVIRLEQVYGLISLAYWYVALVISPLGRVVGKHRVAAMVYVRRPIGVSAAYFAVLHMVVAVWGQLGGLSELQFLPSLFKWSLLGGAIAVVILLMMAATSFDIVIRFMTFRRWKWLHRVGYAGLVLAILHIWAVGTHIGYDVTKIIAFAALAFLAGLESYRVAREITKRFTEFQATPYMVSVFLTIWMIWIAAILAIPAVVTNYHQQRHVTLSRVQHV